MGQTSEETLNIIVSDIVSSLKKSQSLINKVVKEEGIENEKLAESLKTLEEVQAVAKDHLHERDGIDFSVNIFIKDQLKNWARDFWTLQITAGSEKSHNIRCSKILLSKTIENILVNSMEADASEVFINVTQKGLEIVDNGSGISRDELAMIKEKGTTKGEGRGMGLKSVKAFCSRNGWSMSFSNNKTDSKYSTGLTLKIDF